MQKHTLQVYNLFKHAKIYSANIQCVHPFVSWQLFWHSWALPAGLGFRPAVNRFAKCHRSCLVACILQQLTEKDKEKDKDKDNQFQANWAWTLFQARQLGPWAQLSGAPLSEPQLSRAQFAWTATNLICECVAGTLQQRKDQPAAVYQPESELLNKGKV